MEVELGSHSRMDCLAAELSLNSCFWDTVRGQEQGGGLGSPSWLDCLAGELFLDSCFFDTVFVTLLHTAVETAISEVEKLLGTTALTLIVVLAVADSLFGICRSE